MKYLLTCLFKYNLYNRQTSERYYLTDLPRSGGYIYGFQCKLASRRRHNKFLSQNRMLRYRQINVRLLLPASNASRCTKWFRVVMATQKINSKSWNLWQNICLLDPEWNLKMVLYCDYYESIKVLWMVFCLLWFIIGEACILVYCSARSAVI